jgi:hypothetical protein
MRALLLVLTLGGCAQILGIEDFELAPDAAVDAKPDAGVIIYPPTPDAAPPVDADPNFDGGCPVLLPCSFLGCDGTQSVPLYCPTDGSAPQTDACFCASPDGPDGWCRPG